MKGVASELSRQLAIRALKRQKEKKEGSTAANSGLLRGTVVILRCVNMKDMDGVISLVRKLVPSIPKWQLDLVLLGMVREFHGGTETAWVPMGRALSKALQGMMNEGVTAGGKSPRRFVAGVHEVSEERRRR